MNPKGSKNTLLIVVIAYVIAALAGVVGYFAYQRFLKIRKKPTFPHETFQKSQELLMSAPNEKSPSYRQTSVEKIDTSDWETYRNEEYGFEFKFPEKYFLHNTNVDLSVGERLMLERYALPGHEGGEFIVITIFPNPNQLSILKWLTLEGRGQTGFFSLTVNDKFAYDDYTLIEVAGVEGLHFSLALSGPYKGAKANETLFGEGNYIFDFWAGHFFDKDKKLEQDAEKILSTFRLL